MSDNFMLDKNLEQSMSGEDPFQRMRSMSQQPKLVDSQVMSSPFPNIAVGMESAAQAPATEPKLPAFESPDIPFEDLAKQLNLDTKGLSSDPELGQLQILKRMGPGFANNPMFKNLMRAFEQYSKGSQAEVRSATSKGERTLKALLGV